jgi:hypothetical protein
MLETHEGGQYWSFPSECGKTRGSISQAVTAHYQSKESSHNSRDICETILVDCCEYFDWYQKPEKVTKNFTSDNTVNHQFNELAKDIKRQVLKKIKT